METPVQPLGAYPVQVNIVRQERSSRLLTFATLLFLLPKAILLIPHLVILYFLGMFSILLSVVAQVIVLFTGTYPQGLFDLVAGVLRWQVRVNAYFFGLTDIYPPFSISE